MIEIVGDQHERFAQMSYSKIIIIATCLILAGSSLFAGFIIFSPSESISSKIIEGVLFIDDEPAHQGVGVSLIFDHGIANDPDGTNDNGFFSIDVTYFTGDTGHFLINYNDSSYLAMNREGIVYNFQVSDQMVIEPIEIHINLFNIPIEDDSTITNEQDPEDNETENDDETDLPQNDDNSTEEADDDSSDDSTNDDGSNAGGSGGCSGGGSKKDEDPPDNKPSEPDVTDKLLVQSKSMVKKDGMWINANTIEKKESFLHSINLSYNWSNVSYIMLKTQWPDHIDIVENTLNISKLVIYEIDTINNTILINFTSNESAGNITIHYLCQSNASGYYINNVNTTLVYNENNKIFLNQSIHVNVSGSIISAQRIFDSDEMNWVDIATMDIDDVIRYNITVDYVGYFSLSNLRVTNYLPEGMSFYGNSTINTINIEPQLSLDNKALTWVIYLIDNNKVYIEFDAVVSSESTFINEVKINATEDTGALLISSASSYLQAKYLRLSCIKTIRNESGIWKSHINSSVGSQITYNISITNIGKTTLSNLEIIDYIPPQVEYVMNSSRFICGNITFFKEPTYPLHGRNLTWSKFNDTIETYLLPNKTISLLFDAEIDARGIAKNSVNVTTFLENESKEVVVNSTATSNASKPPYLIVDIVGGGDAEIGDIIQFQTSISGGNPPYCICWDLDNDGEFDDGCNQTFYHIWNETGVYIIRARVEDNDGVVVIDTLMVNVSLSSLEVDAGGPYSSRVDLPIQFNSTVSGGVMNYSWFWDFGDGHNSSIQCPEHIYKQTGNYTVVLYIRDGLNNTASCSTQVSILEQDINPPMIILERPANALYIRNHMIFPFFSPVIIGDIEISYHAKDNETGIQKVDLFIQDAYTSTFFSESETWSWEKAGFGKYHIKFIVYDDMGNTNQLIKTVWKIF